MVKFSKFEKNPEKFSKLQQCKETTTEGLKEWFSGRVPDLQV
jgi:hypothetical protein